MPHNEPPHVPIPRTPERPTYTVELRPRARKALHKLDKTVARRLTAALLALSADPRPAGVKTLAGTSEPLLRLRVGDYRIVYLIEDDRLVVVVLALGHHREIYRDV
jgi:mRNA interferase RelE/StbE